MKSKSRFNMPPKSPRHTPSSSLPNFVDSAVEEIVDSAENTIAGRLFSNCSDSCVASTSLFSNNATNRRSSSSQSEQARDFISAVYDLQSAMKFLISNNPNSPLLSRSHGLVQAAMKRLEREFHLILTSNTPSAKEIVPDFISQTPSNLNNNTIVFEIGTWLVKQPSVHESGHNDCDSEYHWKKSVEDLRSIANCMISCGYSVECVKVFKKARISVIEEILAGLNVSVAQRSMSVHKLAWDELEERIKNWLSAFDFAMTKILAGERIQCDRVFSSSSSIQDLCFSEVTVDIALSLLQFPFSVASKCKISLEKVFRFLDMYESISRNLQAISSIFSSDRTSSVRKMAEISLLKLRESVQSCVIEFESAICKDSSKLLVTGGGVHPLTRYVMNYLSFLVDQYSNSLHDILSNWRINLPSSLPSEYEHLHSTNARNHHTQSRSDVSDRFAWLILVLLCKLDGNAELYHDVSLSYLFLANNLSYIVDKVSKSPDLRRLVGEEWMSSHSEKALQYAWSFERVGWSEVLSCLDSWPISELKLEKVKGRFRRFNSAFVEAHGKQVGWVAVDTKVKDEIRSSLRKKVVQKYRDLYMIYRGSLASRSDESVVKFSPEDLEMYLSTLLSGTGGAANLVSSLWLEPFGYSGGRRTV